MTDRTDTLPDPRRAPLFRKGAPSANPRGRPKKQLPRDALTIIERLAARGISEGLIAKSFGFSADTFRARKRADDEVRGALQRGKAARKPLARVRPGQRQAAVHRITE